jgi:tetratricopeptide (TPR) repeat protein
VPPTPSPVLRVVEGLSENSGRTIAVTGPPLSGKSAVLEDLRARLKARGTRVIELRGSYRGRTVPYGGLDGLRSESLNPSEPSTESTAPPTDGGTEPEGDLPMGAGPVIPYLSERLPRSRRSRGERPRVSFLGQPVRGRSANEGNPDAYWREILPEFQGESAHPVAILVEDASLFDTESRDFMIYLSQRARLRPLVIALALDTSVPGFVGWEEAFLGRGDVDWVRFSASGADPREAHRLKSVWDDLPSVTQRVAGFVALLGGSSGEVVLSRVARLNFPQLAEALLPATGVGLLKVQDGRVSIPHLAWTPLTVDLLPEATRKEMHLEIANALAALSPEPNLARRIEVARHYLSWYPGPMALRHLLDAAELGLEFSAFDTAEELLADSIGCLGSLPPSERDPLEPELRLLHAEALFAAGRLNEAESELREGVERALRVGVSAGSLAEWIEPLILSMRVVGPRPSLSTNLMELAERCHDVGMVELEVLFEAMIAEFHFERNLPEKAREESHRAARLARQLPDGHLQAVALLAVGLSRIEGTPEEQELAGRFLSAARTLLGRARRWELDYLAEDLEARLLEAKGDTAAAREIRERSLPGVRRAKLPAVELYHQLGIAEILLNRRTTKGVDAALNRAREITELLHLVPPSPGLLRLWLLEGRQLALNDSTDAARDRWEAIAEEPAHASIPRLRVEAIVRLALMAYARRLPEDAEAWVQRLSVPETQSAIPPAWEAWIGDLERRAPQSDHGGAPLPPPAPDLERTQKSERREGGRS